MYSPSVPPLDLSLVPAHKLGANGLHRARSNTVDQSAVVRSGGQRAHLLCAPGWAHTPPLPREPAPHLLCLPLFLPMRALPQLQPGVGGLEKKRDSAEIWHPPARRTASSFPVAATILPFRSPGLSPNALPGRCLRRDAISARLSASPPSVSPICVPRGAHPGCSFQRSAAAVTRVIQAPFRGGVRCGAEAGISRLSSGRSRRR